MDLEFWFDISCPYAYLASTQVEALADRTGARLVPRPLLLGGVLRHWEQPQHLAATFSPAKARHNVEDLDRWARRLGVPLRWPEGHPIRTVDALRCLLVVDPEAVLPLAHRFYRAYWVEGVNLRSDEGLARVLQEAGLEPESTLARARQPEAKERLRSATDEGIGKGIFGVPAFLVEGELYWGQDRMDQVERALGGRPSAEVPSGFAHAVDFWFDYSSPFAYLASTRVEALFGDKLCWRPMLLGAVFKQVGTPNVPLLAMSEAKRRFQTDDIQRQAQDFGVELRWPEHFPLRTVLALRVTHLSGSGDSEAGRALIHRFFRACWVEGLDPADPEVVIKLCDEVGFPGAELVALASEPEAKAELFASTKAAVEAGVFGAPTTVVAPASDQPRLYWGNDRLALAHRDACGVVP